MKRAVDWAKSHLGIADEFRPDAPPPSAEEREARAREARERAAAHEEQAEQERESKARYARAVWLRGREIAGTPAEQYLEGRGLRRVETGDGLKWPGSLHYVADLHCRPLGRNAPAMVAGIFNAEGRQIGAHRTFLINDKARGWTRLAGKDGKWSIGNVRGGFVPIHKGHSGKSMREMPEGEAVYVTEGIEDALCVRMHMPGARIVCAVNLGNIGAIVLPERAGELVIVADRDASPSAQDKLEAVIAAQQARGMKVGLVMPPPGIKDINDWHVALSAKEGAAA
jgi:hypothetical protein